MKKFKVVTKVVLNKTSEHTYYVEAETKDDIWSKVISKSIFPEPDISKGMSVYRDETVERITEE